MQNVVDNATKQKNMNIFLVAYVFSGQSKCFLYPGVSMILPDNIILKEYKIFKNQ